MITPSKFYIHCGAALSSGARFCEPCGQPVAPAQASAVPDQPAPVPPAQAYPIPQAAMPMQPPPRKSRAGCVIAVLLALIVLCCVASVAGAFIFFFSDIGQEIVPTLEAMATEVAEAPAPDQPRAPRGTPLSEALGGDEQATVTPRPFIDTETETPVDSDGVAPDAIPQDFVGDWEVVAAQAADGSQRDDLVGEQIRFMLSDDGETILGVDLPYEGPTEPGLWLRVVGGRTAAGEAIDADPAITVTVTLSEDGEELEMTMRVESANTASQEVSLTLRRVGEGAGQ